MDYTNFVRTYYRIAITKLNQFTHYSGTFANLNYGLELSSNATHDVQSNLDALPNFELNINAPTEDFIKFFDYYSKLEPELSLVFLGVEGINEAYNLAIEKNYNDENAVAYIELLVDIACDTLKESGVLR